MEPTLKILLLEDSITDAELIMHLLNKENRQHDFQLVMDKKSFVHALEIFSPDVVISDHSLPQFNSADALKLTRQWLMHVPFILVTGTVSEEFATEMMKLGADDYILKDRMARLPGAINAAIKRRKSLKELTDYRYAIDQSAIVAITDQKGIIQYANKNFCKISKYSAKELIGQDHRIINSGYHPASYIKNLWATIAHGNVWRGEFRNKAKDGSIYWVDAFIIPFLNEKGKPYQYLTIRTDITEGKKNAEELRTSHDRFELVVSATNDVIWDWDLKTNHLWWNDNYYSYFGYDENSTAPDINSWQDNVHPDDKARVIAGIRASIAGKQRSWTDEYRFLKSDGSFAFILDYGHILYTEDDRPYRMVGAMLDISNRVIAEEEMRKSNERFQYATQATSDIIWELNFETRDYQVHQDKIKLFSGDKILNWKMWIDGEYIDQEDRQRVRSSFNEATKDPDRKFWEEEYRVQSSGDASMYVINHTIFIRNEEGKAIRAIGALTDITEKRKLQDELFERQKNEQIKITATALEAQEKERSAIGQELHDNVNQILAGTNIFLSMIKKQPEKSQEYIESSIKNIKVAIEENRKIAHVLVTPDFETILLKDLLFNLTGSMLERTGIHVHISFQHFHEEWLKEEQKLAIYRITQEQCTNIIKYSEAKNVKITLSMTNSVFEMIIADDGKGTTPGTKTEGIGIKNIKARLSIFDGLANIISVPGKGFTLEIRMPYE
jgi:PAS domain S-box-containing protein